MHMARAMAWDASCTPDCLSRGDQCNVGTQTEERVELLCLVDGGDGVGKAPEQDRDDHGAPELSHDVEHAVCPVAKDGNGSRPALTALVQKINTVLCMQSKCDDSALLGCIRRLPRFSRKQHMLRENTRVGWRYSTLGYITKAKRKKKAMKGMMTM